MNKYQVWYNKLVETRKDRVLPDDVYTESHHIVPRSLGGSDDTNNLVRLTPREHFIAHVLLVKFATGRGKYLMQFALNMMLATSPDHAEKRYQPSSQLYKLARCGLSEAWSASKRGKPAWNRGIPRTDEVKAAVSKANKGRSPWNKGKVRSEEDRQKMRDGWARRKALKNRELTNG